MRTFITVLMAAAASLAMLAPVEAKSPRSKSIKTAPPLKQTVQPSTAQEGLRSFYIDPSGNLRGYPSWARSALGNSGWP